MGYGHRLNNLLFAAAICAVVPSAAWAVAAFHPAQTPSELALDKILHLSDADQDQLANLLHRPGRDGKVDYTQMMTPALIAALVKEEKKMVQKDCGGKYLDGEECGFDYSPITCAQDLAPSYLYHTVLDLNDRVVIEYAWPNQASRAAVYTLVKRGDRWLIDGITCAGGTAFH